MKVLRKKWALKAAAPRQSSVSQSQTSSTRHSRPHVSQSFTPHDLGSEYFDLPKKNSGGASSKQSDTGGVSTEGQKLVEELFNSAPWGNEPTNNQQSSNNKKNDFDLLFS